MRKFSEVLKREVKEVRDNYIVINGELKFMTTDDEIDDIVNALIEMGLEPIEVKNKPVAKSKVEEPKTIEVEEEVEKKVERNTENLDKKTLDEIVEDLLKGNRVDEPSSEPRNMFEKLQREKKNHFWDSNMVIITKDKNEYKVRLNYGLIRNCSKDDDGKYSEKKADRWKRALAHEIKALGGVWVEGPDKFDFGWYKMTKESAEAYRFLRKQRDAGYESKNN